MDFENTNGMKEQPHSRMSWSWPVIHMQRHTDLTFPNSGIRRYPIFEHFGRRISNDSHDDGET